MATADELNIRTDATADEMAAELFGDGIQILTANYSGDDASSGIYTGADTTIPGVAPSDTGVILSTGRAVDFTNSDGTTDTNQVAGRSTDTAGVDGDADFNSLTPGTTQDAAFIEMTFIPDGDFITLDFVLSSEEYPEFSNSQYNDVVGVWVNGQLAQVTVGDGSASIGNINQGTENIYVDNSNDQFNTEMDGFTITLTFVAPVNKGDINTIKIGVADTADANYDTNLLIAGGSVQSAFVAQDDEIELPAGATRTLDVLANDGDGTGTLTITHVNGIRVYAGDSLELDSGQIITLNDDGTLDIEGDGDVETAYFNYTVEDDNGHSDTALVEINAVTPPCFTRGTMIRTLDGDCAVEDLRPGTAVMTLDNGPRKLLWVGRRKMTCDSRTTPIRFAKGVLGNHKDLLVSPQHRMLITGQFAQLLFGEDEVLVRAKDLVNDLTIRPASDQTEVEYFHLLFSDHEILWSDGALTESYQPGPETATGFDADTQDELLHLFPELDLTTGTGYGPAARLSLKAFEGRVLASHLA